VAGTRAAGLAASFCINLEDPDQPFAVDLRDGPYFLVAETPQSGKTTLLQSWVLALADRHPPERLLLYLVDFCQSGLLGLSDLPHVRAPIADIQGRKTQERKTGYISDGERFAQALAEIETALQQRQAALNEARQKDPGAFRLQAWLDARPTLLMVIDDFEMVDPELPPDAKDLLNVSSDLREVKRGSNLCY